MKYQLIKHNKTNSRTIGVYDTLKAAKREIMSMHGNLVSNSYVGGFPVFNVNNKVYSIQGLHDQLNIVLSIDKNELVAEGLIA